jgi:hypothetical protein
VSGEGQVGRVKAKGMLKEVFCQVKKFIFGCYVFGLIFIKKEILLLDCSANWPEVSLISVVKDA